MTAVRTALPDLERIADHLAGITREATGPVAVFVPMHGLSSHDSSEGHLHEPSLPGPFADYFARVMPGHVPVTRIDAHINDEAFSDAVIAAARRFVTAHRTAA